MSLIAELKRRNVFRMALLYAFASWLILQIGDVLFGLMALPDWSLRLVLGILILGLPIALIFSWLYELTPEGLKRETQVDQAASVTDQTGRKLNIITLVVASLALALLVKQQFLDGDMPSEPATEGSADSATPAEPIESDSPDSDSMGASIAVLAFENMSPDPDNAYFAEGISEEILNVLGRIDGLQVASRTSAFSFAGTNTPIPQIAESLGVEHVLEGSVRRQANRVRITAQLIDAARDKRLWSDTFDRDLDDIFAVQEEIARAITAALGDVLGTNLLGTTAFAVQAPTQDLDAYALFLRGRELFHDRTSLDTAIGDLRAAVERDPDFSEAWAYLASACFVAPGYPTTIDVEDSLECARRAAEKAIELDPNQVAALAVLGRMDIQSNQVNRGIERTRRAARISTRDSNALTMLAGNFFVVGYVDETIQLMEAAYRADPRVGIVNGHLGIFYLARGKEDLAIERIRFAAEHGWPYGYLQYGTRLAGQGRHEEAAASFQSFVTHIQEDLTDDFMQFVSAIASPETIADFRRELLTPLPDGSLPRRRQPVHLSVGDIEGFFDRAEANAEVFPSISSDYVWTTSLEAVRNHPRLFALADKIGIVGFWEAEGYPPGCFRVDADPPFLDCSAMQP